MGLLLLRGGNFPPLNIGQVQTDDVGGKSMNDMGGSSPCRASGLVRWHLPAEMGALPRLSERPLIGQ